MTPERPGLAERGPGIGRHPHRPAVLLVLDLGRLPITPLRFVGRPFHIEERTDDDVSLFLLVDQLNRTLA